MLLCSGACIAKKVYLSHVFLCVFMHRSSPRYVVSAGFPFPPHDIRLVMSCLMDIHKDVAAIRRLVSATPNVSPLGSTTTAIMRVFGHNPTSHLNSYTPHSAAIVVDANDDQTLHTGKSDSAPQDSYLLLWRVYALKLGCIGCSILISCCVLLFSSLFQGFSSTLRLTTFSTTAPWPDLQDGERWLFYLLLASLLKTLCVNIFRVCL